MKSLLRDLVIFLVACLYVGSSNAESILSRAAKQEEDYDWLGAADSLGGASELFSELDCLKRGELHERIGHSFFRAAFQAETVEGFEKRMQHSVQSYNGLRNYWKRLAQREACIAELWLVTLILGPKMIPHRKRSC
jgi:hypothetical protein